jgi:hypothetical protein
VDGSKVCSTCRERKPLEDFNRLTKSSDGRQWSCRACNAAYHQANKEHHNALIHKRNSRLRRRHQREIYEYLLQHPCVDCGESDPVVLEFDHLRDKVMAVSSLVARLRPWPEIEAEIAKCEVRCCNCHRRQTARRGGHLRVLFAEDDAEMF